MKSRVLGSLLLAMALLLTACGAKGGEGSSEPAGAVSQEAKQEEAAVATSESKPLRIGVLFSPEDTLDPNTATSPGSMILCLSIYDALVTISPEGYTLRLAKSIEPNAEFTKYTITLKEGATFTDGSPVTGEDVLLSMKHLSEAPEYQSILGNIDFTNSSAQGGVVTLALLAPTSDFVESALGMFSPVSKGGEFKGIGAGGYRVEKGDPQTGFVLKAYEGYYEGAPAISEISLLPVPDSDSKVKALQTGEIDYAWGLDGSALQVLRGEADIELPGGGMDSAMALELVLNTRVAPFNDPDVRKAAKLTIDREKLVNTVLGESGVVGNDMLGKGFATYPESIAQTQQNQEEARRIFEEKGVKEFTIVSSDIIPGMNKATEMMVQAFQEVGVTVQVEHLDPASFFANMGDLYQKSAFTFYWMNRAPLAEFRSQILKDSAYNVSGYSSETLEANFVAATTTNDPKAQAEAIRAISQEIHDQGGELIWGYQRDVIAVRKGLHSESTQSVPWLATSTFTPSQP